MILWLMILLLLAVAGHYIYQYFEIIENMFSRYYMYIVIHLEDLTLSRRVTHQCG